MTGYAPFDLVYIEPQTLGFSTRRSHAGIRDLLEADVFASSRVRQAKEAIRKARAVQRQRYNRRKRPLPDLLVDDKVMVRLRDRPLLDVRETRSKLESPVEGPFKGIEVLSRHRVRLELPSDLRTEGASDVFHVSQLQVVPQDDAFGRPRLPTETADVDEEFEVLRLYTCARAHDIMEGISATQMATVPTFATD